MRIKVKGDRIYLDDSHQRALRTKEGHFGYPSLGFSVDDLLSINDASMYHHEEIKRLVTDVDEPTHRDKIIIQEHQAAIGVLHGLALACGYLLPNNKVFGAVLPEHITGTSE